MIDIPHNIQQEFFGLMNRLSPENLFCDGECSRSQAMSRQRQIMREWAALERKVGRKVTQDEVETEQIKKWRNSMDNRKIASRLLFLAKEVMGMDFPSQDALDKYLKDHPDADKSNHKVVKTEKKDDMADHPYNQMRKRDNDEKMKEIGKHYKKDPKDLTVDEIIKFNQGGGFVYKPKPHKKVVPTAKSLAKVKKVLEDHNLTDESDELQEMAGFKRTLGQRVPESKKGQFYVRNEAKLKKDFIANMNPENYDSKDAFDAAKKRMQAMPVSDFGKILAAVSDEDTED